MQVVASILLSMLLTLLRKIATQAMFEYLLLAIAEAGVKSTKTDWDDKLLEEIKKALGR